MAQIPEIEFALSEFATYEFAYEDLGGSELLSVGDASASIVAGAFFDSLFTVEGQAHTTFDAVSVNVAGCTVAGLGVFLPVGSAYQLADYALKGSATTGFHTHTALTAILEAVGRAEASFNGQGVAPSLLASESSASVNFTGSSFGYTKVAYVGSASTSLYGSQASHTLFEYDGLASSQMGGSRILYGVFATSGLTQSQFGGETLHSGSFSSHGEGREVLSSQVYSSAGLDLGGASASTDFHGSQIVHANVNAAGNATVEIDLTGSGNTYIYFSSHAETRWEGGRALATRSYISGRSEVRLSGSRKHQSELKSEGTVSWIFQPQDNPEVTIRGRSFVSFSGQAQYSTQLSTAAGSLTALSGLATSNARTLIAGAAEVAMSGQPYRLGTLTSRSLSVAVLPSSRRLTRFSGFSFSAASVAKFNANKAAIAGLYVDAKSQLKLEGSLVLPVSLYAQGSSHFVPDGQATSNGIFAMNAFAQPSMLASEARLGHWAMDGQSISYLYVGSVVFTSLPKAYDRAVREYEPRSVSRPPEIRSAEFR